MFHSTFSEPKLQQAMLDSPYCMLNNTVKRKRSLNHNPLLDVHFCFVPIHSTFFHLRTLSFSLFFESIFFLPFLEYISVCVCVIIIWYTGIHTHILWTVIFSALDYFSWVSSRISVAVGQSNLGNCPTATIILLEIREKPQIAEKLTVQKLCVCVCACIQKPGLHAYNAKSNKAKNRIVVNVSSTSVIVKLRQEFRFYNIA